MRSPRVKKARVSRAELVRDYVQELRLSTIEDLLAISITFDALFDFLCNFAQLDAVGYGYCN
jgi:hypothetical protein